MLETLEKTESREGITIDNDGLNLFGILHRPIQVQNPPVVTILHGFASSKHGSNRCYVTLAELLAKEGIASLRFDFRGCGDSEGSLSEASFNEMISDAVAASKHLLTLEGIDISRMGVFGASLGGALAVESSALCEMTKAMALWAPVASGELWLRDFMMKHPEMIGVDPRKALSDYRGIPVSSAFKEQFAALFAYKTLAGMPDIPLLHMHGEGDDVVSIAHQDAFKQACSSQGKFVTYPDEAHSLGYAKVFAEAIQETVTFFKEHLG